MRAERARDAEQVQRQLQRLRRELARSSGAAACSRSMSRNGVGTWSLTIAHHLLGRDAVGRQRGDQRAGAGADVDVELVDRAVDRQQVERPQRADLVDAAGEAAAAQHERGAGLRARTALPGPLLELDDLAHPRRSLLPGSAGSGEVLVARAHDDRLALDLVADLDAAPLDGDQRAVAAVLDAPARAADGRRRVAPAGAERALGVAEQAPDALLRLLLLGGDRRLPRLAGLLERGAGQPQLGDELLRALLDPRLADGEAPAEELAALELLGLGVGGAADLDPPVRGVERGADGDRLGAQQALEALGRLARRRRAAALEPAGSFTNTSPETTVALTVLNAFGRLAPLLVSQPSTMPSLSASPLPPVAQGASVTVTGPLSVLALPTPSVAWAVAV